MSYRVRTMRWAGLGVVLVLVGLGALAQGMSPATTGGGSTAASFTTQDSNGACVLSNGAGPVALESCSLNPATDLGPSFGAAAARWNTIFGNRLNFGGAGVTYNNNTNQGLYGGVGAGNGMLLRGQEADGATAVANILDNSGALANAAAKLLSIRNNAVEKASFYFDGYLASPTPHTLWTAWPNGSLTAALKLGAYVLPAKAFTVTGVTGLTTVASVGAGNTVITITDGTNTCTATYTCAAALPTGSGALGGARVTVANGAGTGCVYAASAALTASVTTAGCATTQPSFQDLHFEGKWQ